MSKTAHILAVDAERLPPEIKFTNGFHPMAPEELIDVLTEAGLFVGPRPLLEQDERFRQIIPYVVLKQSPDFIVYRRGTEGGEARLHGKLSIGIGGHMDMADAVLNDDGSIDLERTLSAAAERELYEEVRISDRGRVTTAQDAENVRWSGLLIDSSNAVGRVHIGIVGVVEASGEVHSAEAKTLTSLVLMSGSELEANRNRLEAWSALLLPHLKQL